MFNKKFATTCGDNSLFQFLYDSGLLYEINRTALHPQGLALAVNLTDDVVDGVTMYETDDPAGIYFGEEAAREGFAKFKDYLATERVTRVADRLEAYGGLQQLHPKYNG